MYGLKIIKQSHQNFQKILVWFISNLKTSRHYFASDIDEKKFYQNYDVIKEARILPTGKVSCKEIYSILILNILNKPTSNIYFEKLFESTTVNWSKSYLLPCLTIVDSTLRSFQYKILNNLLFLNKNLIQNSNNLLFLNKNLTLRL